MSDDLDAIKELKVRVPTRYHNQLHIIKLLKGKTMTDAVREALDDFFDDPANRVGPDYLGVTAGKT